jgi:ATP-dependent DNA helicase RecG
MLMPVMTQNSIEEKSSLRYFKGIGPKRAEAFAKVGVLACADLLKYFPFRYEDRRNFKKIAEIKDNEPVLVKAKVLRVNLKKIPYFKARKVKSIFEAAIDDGSQAARCVWFNQHYLASYIRPGDEIIVYGKPERDGLFWRFNSPQYDSASNDDSLNLGRIVGFYGLTEGLTQKLVRKTVFACLGGLKGEVIDPLPFSVREKENIPNIAKAFNDIHFPGAFEDADCARRRFIFEELFFSQIQVHLRKERRRREKALSLTADNEFFTKFKNRLDFTLTVGQTQAVDEILSDIKNSFPMRRLLQGDVGCGKTVVAAFGLGVCAKNGFQAALMVPTEVLAWQHKETLEKIFNGFGFNVGILTSSLSAVEHDAVCGKLASGEIDIVVGTHALIQEDVVFKNLAFVAIDEQHKFGVAQRAMLPKKKGGVSPHCLVMSATPIPRSLALSFYGDLDLSVITESPQGRVKAENILITEDKSASAYAILSDKIKEGRQAYMVYPVIEETADDGLNDLEAAYEEIKVIFKGINVGIFHGRMATKEKLKVMNDFKAGRIKILMATTVVEVGVDVPNASVMVVTSPERFGLAQLHQLRGRICRSIHKPVFILVGKNGLALKAKERLQVIINTDDGFKIAEQDLLQRGPGEFFGTSQHGLPELAIANPLRDIEALERARQAAGAIVKDDPGLIKHENLVIKNHLNHIFKS